VLRYSPFLSPSLLPLPPLLFFVFFFLFLSLFSFPPSPVVPSEGNHEACTTCKGVDGISQSAKNFTQYRGRFAAVEMYAGANSLSNSNRYYSFNRGLNHFVVLTAEAYLYAKTPAFLANQLSWLKADLAAVDRKVTPWIVVNIHKVGWQFDVLPPLLLDYFNPCFPPLYTSHFPFLLSPPPSFFSPTTRIGRWQQRHLRTSSPSWMPPR
jgi:hypothetical protein